MTKKTLKTQYKHLSARERLSLLLASASRGDEWDMQALLSTAPRVYASMPHTTGRVLAFRHVTMLYFIEQFANYSGMVAAEAQIKAKDDGAHQLRDLLAFSVAQRALGWAAFCEKNMVDDDLYRSLVPCWVNGSNSLELIIQTAEDISLDQAKLAARLQVTPDNILTESIYSAQFQEMFDEEVESYV